MCCSSSSSGTSPCIVLIRCGEYLRLSVTPRVFLQAAVFVLLFLAILLPVSYMVRTNGDVKDRFAGFYAEKKDSLDVVKAGIGCGPTSSRKV